MTAARVQIAGGAEVLCQDGETLLRAALRQGLGFPYECVSGGCGSCQFELLEGDVEDVWADAPGLSAEARAARRRLACQSRVSADCRIKVRLKPQYVPPSQPVVREARYVGRRALTADMAEYTFHCDGPANFLPGQFAMLRLPGVVGDRAYSMSNLPNSQGHWSFIIKKVPNGRGTAVLDQSLREADTITLDGPYGTAHFRPERDRDIVCVGGGSGLSPLKSILSAAVREKSLEGRRIHLFYGGRTPSDICVDTLLNEDALLKARVDVISACSSADVGADWQGKRGFIHDVLNDWMDKDAPSDAKDCEFYFCGPPPMTDAVQKLLVLERKVPMQQIHFDRFV